jgi:hypothetical protein
MWYSDPGASAGSGSGVGVGVITNVGPSGAVVLSQALVQTFVFDTTGGAFSSLTTPTSPNVGDAIRAKGLGATNTNGVRFIPSPGQSIEDPQNPGVLSAAFVAAFAPGFGLLYVFVSGSRWVLF